MGKTTKEKTLSNTFEFAEWWDGMPSALWAVHVTKVQFSMKFGFAQLGDPTIWGMMYDAAIDRTNPATTIVNFGTNPGAAPDFMWFFVGELVDKREIQLVIRRGRIRNPEDITFGSGEHTVGNVTVEALKDDTICDTESNLAYLCIESLGVPSGGFVDPCASEVTFCEP